MVRKLDLVEFIVFSVAELEPDDNGLTDAKNPRSLPILANRPCGLDEPTPTPDHRLPSGAEPCSAGTNRWAPAEIRLSARIRKTSNWRRLQNFAFPGTGNPPSADVRKEDRRTDRRV